MGAARPTLTEAKPYGAPAESEPLPQTPERLDGHPGYEKTADRYDLSAVLLFWSAHRHSGKLNYRRRDFFLAVFRLAVFLLAVFFLAAFFFLATFRLAVFRLAVFRLAVFFLAAFFFFLATFFLAAFLLAVFFLAAFFFGAFFLFTALRADFLAAFLLVAFLFLATENLLLSVNEWPPAACTGLRKANRARETTTKKPDPSHLPGDGHTDSVLSDSSS